MQELIIYKIRIQETESNSVATIKIFEDNNEVAKFFDQLSDNKKIGIIKDYNAERLSVDRLMRENLDTLGRLMTLDGLVKLISCNINKTNSTINRGI